MDPRFLLLLACFFLSGFAALLYQTVWTRELAFVFGTSELAVAAVLAAYMGGLALGAAAAARYAMRIRRPVLAYGVLELAIAVCALLVPWGIRAVNTIYVSVLGGSSELTQTSTAAALLQLVCALATLLPPTALMGATLPLLARHAVHREEEIASRVGVLYAVNTAGAIAGTVFAAFWLMPELGLRRTVWVGAALNALVFGLAARLSRAAPLESTQPGTTGSVAARGAFWILPAILLSGAVSFVYEVMWTRLLGHLLGASVHAFATMLASFLLGIALGSAVAARVAGTRQRAAVGFVLSQLGIAATSYVAFGLTDWLPDLSIRLGAGPGSPVPSALLAGAALLPITLCIGATFPFAVRILAHHPEEATGATARIYSWNTVGAIVGALAAGFVLLPLQGFEGTLAIGVGCNLALAALATFAEIPRRLAPIAAVAAGVLVLAFLPPRPPWKLITTSPMTMSQSTGEIIYYAVGRTSTITLSEENGRYQLMSSGLPEAWVDSHGMLTETNVAQWLGVLPALLRPEARNVLVVGLGGGVALELAPSTYAKIDVIELEPEVLEALRRIGDERARDPLADPRVAVHIGDARGTLQLANRRFDGIVSQPSHPWTAGASHLYTREFFSLVRDRLSPDGVFVQWIGINFVDEALVQSLLQALLEVFPHVEMFRPQNHGLLFVGSRAPIDALAGAARALQVAPADFARLGIHRIEDFASAWIADEAGVRALAAKAPPNTDDNNLLAAHSATLGDTKLDVVSARALLDRYDPLPSAPGLDRSALIRRLASRGQSERATDLAMAAEGAEEEAGLGWLEIAAGRMGRATRYFERALSLAPGDPDALAGLIASQKFELTHGRVNATIAAARLSPPYAALIAGWRQANAGDWAGVAALRDEISRIEPGDPLFEEAARLRISAILEGDDPQAAAEGQALAETVLLRSWHPFDALLRARCAIQAGRPLDAWGSLQRIGPRISTSQRGRALAERSLEVAKELPPGGRFDELRRQLALQARGVKPTSGGRGEETGPRETWD